jgi:hypothetical protein
VPEDNQQAVWDRRYRRRRDRFPRLVAEGDSWFAYPVWLNLVDFVDASDRWAIRRLGTSGRRLREIFEDGAYLDAVRRERPRLLLLSGGGNDFVNERFVTGRDGDGPIFRRFEAGMDAADLVAEPKWSRKLEELHGMIDRIVERVGDVPVLMHGYDYIIPSNEPARYDGINVGGPWIQPTMRTQGIDDEALQRRIARLIIDSLNDMLGRVAADRAGRFVHVDLRDELAPADWANEIHPFQPGFEALAARLLAAIDAHAEPGRIA